MPLKRNPDTINLIIQASRLLFDEKGYAATSYNDIAKKSGVKRGTVQHYFPSKELMAKVCLERLREECEKISAETFSELTNPYAKMFSLGQIYLSALLCCESAKRFFVDILEYRQVANALIGSDFSWAKAKIWGSEVEDTDERSKAKDIVVAMGGLHELMYFCILNNLEVDISERLRPAMLIMAKNEGRKIKEVENFLNQAIISVDDLQLLGRKAYQESFLKI